MACDVFISFSSKDRSLADRVVSAIEASGSRCWIAHRDAPPGVPYGEAIVDAIELARMVLLVLTRHSNESEHVLREIERAANARKRLLIFEAEEVTPSKGLSYFICPVHWLVALPRPTDGHVAMLAASAQRLLQGEPAEPGRVVLPRGTFQERSIAWLRDRWPRLAAAAVVLFIVLAVAIPLRAWMQRVDRATAQPVQLELFHLKEPDIKREIHPQYGALTFGDHMLLVPRNVEGKSLYLLSIGGDNDVKVLDESAMTRDATGAWRWDPGPPPFETMILLACDRRLSESERSELVAKITALGPAPSLSSAQQIVWSNGDWKSVEAGRGNASVPVESPWPTKLCQVLKSVKGMQFEGRTVRVNPS
jgi:hypothetical protein